MCLEHDDYARSTIDVSDEDEALVIDSIANATPPPSSTARIHKVPPMVRATQDYQKYYVPKVVSLGPHHYGDPKLEFVEKLKPHFTMELLSNDKETLTRLYKTLGKAEMVQELRGFYEEKSTNEFNDKAFTKMMLLDGCFILYYIQQLYELQTFDHPGRAFSRKAKDAPRQVPTDGNCLQLMRNTMHIRYEFPISKLEKIREFKSHQIVFIHQDMLLLENQIPYKVLGVVMESAGIDLNMKIKQFIDENILARGRPKKRWLFQNDDQSSREESKSDFHNADHLLHLLHRSLIKKGKNPTNGVSKTHNRCTFRNVNELMDVGIHFKPSAIMSLAHVEFFRGWWWWWSANVKLAPITVDDSTKPMLLNLISYEMSSLDACDSWVTAYICLLDSLIDHPEDVKTLRKAGVLENSLGSDEEVAKLFNEIGTDLVPNNLAYLDVKKRIQRHYESRRNTLISQLKHEYVKSPWAFLALVGALMSLVLSGVQAYFSVWSPKSQCDDLCMFLKMNHHL